MAERRGATRFPVAWPIRITGLERAGLALQEWGDLRNLSSRGALVGVNSELPVGAQAEVLIKVPWRGDTWMKFLATVTRVESVAATLVLGLRFAACRPQFLINMNISQAMEDRPSNGRSFD